MRKRILLLALLFAGAVSAQTVSVDDAMRAATDFLRRSAMSGQSAMTNADGTVISVGNVSGITPLSKKADAPAFDLSGRRADASSHGIIISEGKKYLNK